MSITFINNTYYELIKKKNIFCQNEEKPIFTHSYLGPYSSDIPHTTYQSILYSILPCPNTWGLYLKSLKRHSHLNFSRNCSVTSKVYGNNPRNIGKCLEVKLRNRDKLRTLFIDKTYFLCVYFKILN